MYETWLIVPLSIVYGALLALTLAAWVRQPRTRYLNRWVWLFIILVFSGLGPLAYLLLGHEWSEGQGHAECG